MINKSITIDNNLNKKNTNLIYILFLSIIFDSNMHYYFNNIISI